MLRILLVDDSPSIRSVLRVFLSWISNEILEAEDGARALTLLRLHPVDVVIADIRMPGMDGLEFLKHVRADPEPRRAAVPVVLLTSERGESLRSEAMRLGANALIHKPVTSAEFIETVRSVVPLKASA